MDIFKSITGVLLLAILAILVSIGIWLGSYWIRGETAPFRGDIEATERTQSGSYRIAAYDHFFSLCSAVQSDENRIENLEEELENASSDSRQEQLEASLTAVKNSRDEKINTYNADARREYTQGQFRDSSLPWELHHDRETTCNA